MEFTYVAAISPPVVFQVLPASAEQVPISDERMG